MFFDRDTERSFRVPSQALPLTSFKRSNRHYPPPVITILHSPGWLSPKVHLKVLKYAGRKDLAALEGNRGTW
jgi:hypothetical protein